MCPPSTRPGRELSELRDSSTSSSRPRTSPTRCEFEHSTTPTSGAKATTVGLQLRSGRRLKSQLPAPQETAELVAFLPLLYEEGFIPIKKWHGGVGKRKDSITMPWPEYEEIVEEFFRVASGECWSDHEYRPDEAGRMLRDHNAVKNATLSQVKTMLTYCVRGERFCDGHWGKMIESGHLRRLLERLAEF